MIRALTLILFIWASGASAQALRVRSGEHDGYTRLVVQVPAGTDWTLDQRQNGARLNISIDDVTFDTRIVFDRLSGTRLQALTQTEPGGALDMRFGCDCVGKAFLHQNSMVVIDIKPGVFDPPPAPVPELPLTPPTSSPTSDEAPVASLALSLLHLNRLGFEGQLMSRILQGADREVVDLNLAEVGPRLTVAPGSLHASEKLASNLKLRSVLDDVRGLEALALPPLSARTECITDRELGFDNWSDARPFAIQVAAYRVGLFQEFDRVDYPRAIQLAQVYVYHGFGAEAAQVLDLLGSPAADQEQLLAIAHAMDGAPVPTSNPFAGQQRCDGSAAFWAVITEGKLTPDANLNAIEQGFGRLPRHLRRHLAATLSEILISAGKLEASRRILRAVGRVTEVDSVDVKLAKADIATAEGDVATAETLLSDIAASANTITEAPLALARLIDRRWSDRGTIAPGELELAAGYAQQLRRSELGPMMAQTHVLALALSQEFDDALRRIETVPDMREWQRTRDQVLQLLAERADDITFLRHALAMSDKTRNSVSVDTAVSLAERLVDLGFTAPAQALASRPQDRTRRLNRAQLRSQVALLQNRPRQALLEIAGDDSARAERLRAQAITQTQDYTEAARVLREAGETEAADRYDWLAGSAIDDTKPSTRFGVINQISTHLTQVATRQPDKPLADAAALLEDSAMARGQIADLLARIAGAGGDQGINGHTQ